MLFKAYPMIHPMTDPKDSRVAAPKQFSEAVSVGLRSERVKRDGHADGMAAMFRSESLFHLLNVSRPVAIGPQADAASVTPDAFIRGRGRTERLVALNRA